MSNGDTAGGFTKKGGIAKDQRPSHMISPLVVSVLRVSSKSTSTMVMIDV